MLNGKKKYGMPDAILISKHNMNSTYLLVYRATKSGIYGGLIMQNQKQQAMDKDCR